MKRKVINIELKGEMPSKKNAWSRSVTGQVFIKKPLRDELDAFLWEIKSQKIRQKLPKPLNGSISVEAVFHVKSVKIDLDNALTTLLDLLQGAGVIENDKLVTYLSAKRFEGESFTTARIEGSL